jgi:hypothetical protein
MLQFVVYVKVHDLVLLLLLLLLVLVACKTGYVLHVDFEII